MPPSAAGETRAGSDGDVIDGARPRLVAAPETTEALAETLAWASAEELGVVVTGGGTKLAWGAPPGAIDLQLSTARLGAVLDHRHGDLTATIQAGTTLASANMELAGHGQRLPWDPPWPDRATIGGIVATNDSGPRRHGYGSPRDAIIGVSIARPDGQVAKAGGIVVKNVAGYDLSRLLTGSFGCLGVILTATFKLAPLPVASRTVEVTADTLEAIATAAVALTGSRLTPTAVELTGAPPRLLVRFESVEASVAQQADEAVAIARAEGAAATVLNGAAEEAAWRRHAEHWDGDGTLLKLSTAPAELFPTLVQLRDRAAEAGVALVASGRAGLGVVDLRLDGPAEAQARLIRELRDRLPIGRGSAVIRRGSTELRSRIDPWGPIGDALPLMRAVKRQFDPDGRLNSGRGPGGC